MENTVPQTAYIGQTIIRLKEVGSTNDYLKEMLKLGEPEIGTAVVAHHQTQGRGRQGKAWFGSPGLNLYCSVFLKPNFLTIQKAPFLNFAVSLAVHDTLSGFLNSNKIEIKWPNDIIVDDMKVAGMLVENGVAGGRVSQSVVGIGINVNERNFPNELDFASSIMQLSGSVTRTTDVMNKLFESLERRMTELQNHGGEVAHRQYMERLYLRDKWVNFELEGAEQKGILKGVDTDGRLQLEIGGKLETYFQGEIKLKVYGVDH